MRPVLDLAPGADQSALASRLVELVRGNIDADPALLTTFRALRGSIALVATDADDAVTLRFDHGRLTAHRGIVGIPDVSIRGPHARLSSLSRLPMLRGTGVPFPRRGDPQGQSALRELLGALRRGELVVYGLSFHPRMISRFLRLVSEPS